MTERAREQEGRGRRTGAPLLFALALLSCDRRAPAPVASQALPPGVIARVGSIEITDARVARIAAAQRVSVREARDIAVRDALLVQGALDRGLDRAPEVDREITGGLARAMLRRLLADARATPLTEGELREAAARRWLEVDRPEGFRTVHAVVRFDPQKDDAAKKAAALAVAEAIRAATLPISERAATMPLPEGAPPPSSRQLPADDPDPLSGAFRKAASAVPAQGLEVVVEPLPAVAADGRVLAAGNEALDPAFSRAAATLAARGALSAITPTSFGFHVILLLERTPARVFTGDARAQRLMADIVNERARAAEKRVLAGLRAGGKPSPDAAGLIELPNVEP